MSDTQVDVDALTAAIMENFREELRDGLTPMVRQTIMRFFSATQPSDGSTPLPPAVLVDALQDKIHKDGPGRAARSVKVPTAGQAEPVLLPWPPVCHRCEQPLSSPGAVYLSPPDSAGWVKKLHYCVGCAADLIATRRSRPPEPADEGGMDPLCTDDPEIEAEHLRQKQSLNDATVAADSAADVARRMRHKIDGKWASEDVVRLLELAIPYVEAATRREKQP